LQGHTRPLTTIKYNLDGDLLFSAAKDLTPTVWYADTGERLGTYGKLYFLFTVFLSLFSFILDYHGGAVYDIDPSWDSEYVVTACADANARLFEAVTGKYIARMPHKGYKYIMFNFFYISYVVLV
jgi:translation initiation factor 3 subunit I